jgi:serine protease Do
VSNFALGTIVMPSSVFRMFCLIGLGLTASAVVGCGRKSPSALADAGTPGLPPSIAPTVSNATNPTLPTAQPPFPSAPMSFAGLVKKTDPAVVTVFAAVERTAPGGRKLRLMEGLGTGFIYEPSGYVLTNNHVIENATNITVRLADERRESAKLVGRDPLTDVAILKIGLQNLSYLPLGNSKTLQVGDWVVAIGNPFGLSHTVSSGIISAKGRTRDDLADLDKTGRGYFNFLQTDAAINQGNSGGPLIDLHGQVVGINTAIRANANNIGFAIPINMVKELIPKLVKDGYVKRSALGVTVGPLLEAERVRLNRPSLKGALVHDVGPGGPADKAGIAQDDVILTFNGKEVSDPNELRWLASMAGIKTSAKVKIARGKREFEVNVVLGELPSGDVSPPR